MLIFMPWQFHLGFLFQVKKAWTKRSRKLRYSEYQSDRHSSTSTPALPLQNVFSLSLFTVSKIQCNILALGHWMINKLHLPKAITVKIAPHVSLTRLLSVWVIEHLARLTESPSYTAVLQDSSFNQLHSSQDVQFKMSLNRCMSLRSERALQHPNLCSRQ